ncbi:protein-disulfide reductase DsbD [bacterium]|nr:protein-disulfide reductase DsbD [bacterium]MBU1993793.1 protein-disulfide reductase DsbD [bacterium]
MKKIVLFLFGAVLLFAAPPKFLMPDEAFIPHAKLNDAMQIEASVQIAKDIYVYADKMKFELKNADTIKIAEIVSPESSEHEGEMVYTQSPDFLITLQNTVLSTGIKTVEFELSFQGCSEQGLCYEPLSKTYSFDIDTSKLHLIQKATALFSDTKSMKKEDAKEISQTDSIANTISSGSLGLILLTFFGFGLLLALTPCVFPMIPIISGVIISQGEGLTTKKAFFLSVVYVLAMAVAYTIAGVLAGLFGSNLQAALQTPWVIYSFAAVFVALAMSLFGFYELKPPSFLLTKVSQSRQHRGVFSVAIMGFLSALIVGPCVAAPLAGALVYIGQTGDALLGGMALFVMSIGMGLPLIVVGVSAGRFMPKPGHWMVMVTNIFGIMMLGVAVWMLGRVIDIYITMLLWSILGIGAAIYFGVFEKEIHVFRKSLAVILFIYATVLFVGTLGGGTSMTKPLEFLKPQVMVSDLQEELQSVEFEKVSSLKELDVILSKNKGKKIMLDFYADWCTACKELEEITFSDNNVMNKMSEFVLIQADITANGKEQKELSKKYGVFGPPAILFFDKNAKVIKSKTIVGFIGPDEFLAHLNKI